MVQSNTIIYFSSRLKNLKNINKIIVAIGKDKNYLKIVKECKKINVEYFIGSELDVIDRFYQLCKIQTNKYIKNYI